jgi:geranylgeranyl transferase type-1 subunit beta
MTLNLATHTQYFLYLVNKGLPNAYQSLDPNRLTVTHFAVAGLGVLGHLDKVDRRPIIDWVYHLLISSSVGSGPIAGFRGGSSLCFDCCGGASSSEGSPHDLGHIAMAYSALVILKSLGDDLARLPKQELLRGIRQLQCEDGRSEMYEHSMHMQIKVWALPINHVSGAFSFCSHHGGENDMRFVYCAAVVCHLLDDWGGIDIEKATTYITRSQVCHLILTAPCEIHCVRAN